MAQHGGNKKKWYWNVMQITQNDTSQQPMKEVMGIVEKDRSKMSQAKFVEKNLRTQQ